MVSRRKFDESDVLTKATRAFWARGYTATSMQDLVDCMGMNRGSIYATFGNKRALFIRALHHFFATEQLVWLTELRSRHSPRAACLAAFEEVVDLAMTEEVHLGCFITNTALEMAPYDPEIAAIVAESLDEFEGFFRDMVEQGQEMGEIPGHIQAKSTAQGLMGLFTGLRVYCRSRPRDPQLSSLAQQARAFIS
ncbi:MAG: TetR/AcrR family transcriptional regulator [Paracoccaceae bacterium]